MAPKATDEALRALREDPRYPRRGKRTLDIKRRVTYLPIALAKLAAPLCEKRSLRRKKPLYFTPYSVSVLASNSLFSRRAAASAFGFSPRQVADSIRDTVLWLKERKAKA